MSQLDPKVEEGFVEPSGDAFKELVRVMAQLRAPDGCPWDQEQTHQSLARHLLEETYETLEAIDNNDLSALREELGDLVLQVVFHSEIAFEEGAFGVAEVLDDLKAKLIRRHPHVFGSDRPKGAPEEGGPITAQDVTTNWEKIKKEEKGDAQASVLDGIPKALPALSRAARTYRKAVGAGFSFETVEDVVADLEDEVAELRAEVTAASPDLDAVEGEVGDVLFSAVCVAQRLGLEPETALRKMLDRFATRFGDVESYARADGRELESLSVQQWQEYWTQAKADEANR